MENFCQKGTIEKKAGYLVCRGEKWQGSLRYDLTLLYSKQEIGELPRTSGHYHTPGFAELFEVIKGKTLALMQKYQNAPDMISEAYLVEAKAGEKFIILPDFGFTNINPEKENVLLLANWIDKKVENKYEFIKELNGFCYRVLRNKKGEIIFEKNENYKQVPEIIRLKPKPLPKELENLEFLSNPKKYAEILTKEKLYYKV